MLPGNRFPTVACLLLCALPAVAADSVLVVDRGLPQNNLNNASGSVRSNVRWTGDNQGFIGDDFTVGKRFPGSISEFLQLSILHI